MKQVVIDEIQSFANELNVDYNDIVVGQSYKFERPPLRGKRQVLLEYNDNKRFFRYNKDDI